MQSAFIVTNGGLEESNNYAQLFRTREEADAYTRLMRINPTHNTYEIEAPERGGIEAPERGGIEAPEREECISIMFTHTNKKKTAQYVASQAECTSVATAYFKEKYDEYLAESLRTKSCNYRHMRIKSCLLFQPNCTILQLFGESSGLISFSCISDIVYSD